MMKNGSGSLPSYRHPRPVGGLRARKSAGLGLDCGPEVLPKEFPGPSGELA